MSLKYVTALIEQSEEKMKPVRQTAFGGDHGNCWSACIASVLEIPIEDVPNFCVEQRARWWDATNDWLRARGLVCLNVNLVGEFLIGGYWIASGKSPRGAFDHSVVYLEDQMVHDPHPSNAGLDGGPRQCSIIYPLDVGQWSAHA